MIILDKFLLPLPLKSTKPGCDLRPFMLKLPVDAMSLSGRMAVVVRLGIITNHKT